MQLQIIIKYGSRREYPPERQAAQAYRSCEGRMGGKKSMSSEISKNFIEQMIDKDLAEGVYDTVHTRVSRRSPMATCISDMPRASF